eukprot:19286-Heterococcus_DN1.PRE.2
MEEVSSVSAGDVVAMFGVDCASMDTFTDGTTQLAMSSMFVPEPVMSLAIKPDLGAKAQLYRRRVTLTVTEYCSMLLYEAVHCKAAFGKALQRFTKEDPTLRVHTDTHSKEVIISGMGELHLDVYVERLKREYEVACEVGKPSVNYRETIARKAAFNYLHKKQSGGSGQYARVVGYIEPLEEGAVDKNGELITYEFQNDCIGTNIPPEYIPSCGKGFADACERGAMIGAQVQGMRVVLTDGQAHAVDSSDLAFRLAAAGAVRTAMRCSCEHCITTLVCTMLAARRVCSKSARQRHLNELASRSWAILQTLCLWHLTHALCYIGHNSAV